MKMFDSALSALALGQKNLSALWIVPSVLIQPAHLVERIGLCNNWRRVRPVCGRSVV